MTGGLDRILYPAQSSFKMKVKIGNFSDQRKQNIILEKLHKK